MIISRAPSTYDAREEQAFREEVRRAGRDSIKRGQDIELVGARLILTAPGGTQFLLKVADDGTLSTVPV